jgi:transposase
MALKLTDAEWDALDEFRFATTDRVRFRNATVILMTSVGRPKADIARELGCCTATVDNIRRRYREQGIAGLVPGKSSGRPSRATPDVRAALRELVRTLPSSFGYGFNVWSVGRLGAHLLKTVGSSFSDDRLREILHEEGFSFQRPKHTMKGKRDEAAYSRAQKKLTTLKKGQSKQLAAC